MSGPDDVPTAAATVRVEVAYGLPERQALVTVELPVGATVGDAIAASRMAERFPGLEVDPARVGIFGRKASLDELLGDGDRVEIYRPLLVDPKETRRARGRQQKRGA